MKQLYITTTLPYVNADPHIGFALEIVQADAWARSQRLIGNEVFFNTGTDEHGLKIYRKAEEMGISPLDYCTIYADKFSLLREALNLSYTAFIRTTNEDHKAAAQEFWRRCLANGDIYKKNYQIKYCVGCELEKTESELVDGKCPLHPNLEVERINEENYFFRWSKYQQPLLEHYAANPDFVQPVSKLNEITAFVSRGLEDFSISRLKSKMPWGVPVPDDEEHVMYVWFDALVNYISTTGWPKDDTSFTQWWPGIQVAGKDNLRQQSAMWQAMLMSAQLPLSRQIFIHGFITANGQKMSKSLGNVVNPFDLVEQFGTDAVRYYLLKEIPSLDDGDFSMDRMKEVFETDLANELGNLVMRLTTMSEKDTLVNDLEDVIPNQSPEFKTSIMPLIESFQFNTALEEIWKEIKLLNKSINDFEPWKKLPEDRKDFLMQGIKKLYTIGTMLLPFMPETGNSIMISTSGTITKSKPLFPKHR